MLPYIAYMDPMGYGISLSNYSWIIMDSVPQNPLSSTKRGCFAKRILRKATLVQCGPRPSYKLVYKPQELVRYNYHKP